MESQKWLIMDVPMINYGYPWVMDIHNGLSIYFITIMEIHN